MKKISISAIFIFVLLLGQTARATNGDQLISLGAYGEGMAGAVTAAPGDSTTAVTNPAGLTKVGARTDLNFEMFMPVRTMDFSQSGGSSSTGGSPMYLLPNASFNAPINDDNTLFFSMGFYLVAGFGVDYDVMNTTYFLNNPPTMPPTGPLFTGHVFSQYQFWKIAPAIAKKWDNLSVGAALNIDYQQLAIKEWFTNNTAMPAAYGGGAPGTFAMGIDAATPAGSLVYGFTLGALYEVSDSLSIGINYISQQNFGDIQYRLAGGDINYAPGGIGSTFYTSQNGVYSLHDFNFPQQYSIGLAYKPMEGMLIAADFKTIKFGDTMKNMTINGNYITNQGQPTQGTATSMVLPINWSDVNVWALALQYELVKSSVIRVGYNQANSPFGSGADTSANWASPAIITTHYTVGFTQDFGKQWEVNLAYVDAPKQTQNGVANETISLGGSSFTFDVTCLFR